MKVSFEQPCFLASVNIRRLFFFGFFPVSFDISDALNRSVSARYIIHLKMKVKLITLVSNTTQGSFVSVFSLAGLLQACL